MYHIGMDIGSTYTKYCVMLDNEIESLSMEKTPIRQKEFFKTKLNQLLKRYPGAQVVSCGYGKRNVDSVKQINELTALAKGSYFVTQKNGSVLDIGGQDTKLIIQEQGILRDFFVNGKCASGSGMFLLSAMDMVGKEFNMLDLTFAGEPTIYLSSVCAVFAQSEVVELIADNRSAEEILQAVIWQMMVKAKPLLAKAGHKPVFLSGGLSQIKGIAGLAERVLEVECQAAEYGTYLAAIGCAC